MNYQTSALFLYSGKVFLYALVCVFLDFWEVNAPAFYLLGIGIVLPVAISLRLHILKQKGAMFTPDTSSEWIVYVNAIPVRETRRILSNPGGFSPERLRSFFAWTFGVKLCLQLMAVAVLLFQMTGLPVMLIALTSIVLIFMLYGIWRSTGALLSILSGSWRVIEQPSSSGSVWYYGYLVWRGKTGAALDRLLAL